MLAYFCFLGVLGFFFVVFYVVILIGVKCYLVVLIYISLMMNEAEDLFPCPSLILKEIIFSF